MSSERERPPRRRTEEPAGAEMRSYPVDEDALLAEITRVTDARAETLPDGELYYPWPDEG